MADKIMTPDEFYKRLSKDDKRAVRNLEERERIDFVPTGSWVINTLIGDGTGTYKPGGLPRGHMVEIFGDESCGKTTLGISSCIQAQQLGFVPVWLDYERTFHADYARKLGLDCSPSKFIYMEPDHFEHGIRLIYQALAMKPAIIVVDSVSAMIPKQFLEGQVDEGQRIGLQAQLMSMFCNFITKYLGSANTCLMFCNQLRSMIKGQYDPGPKEETSGGKALKYYSSVRIKMRKSKVENVTVKSRITGKSEKEPINVMVKVSIVKNKIDKPYFSGPLYIRFGEGFDNITSIIELATNTNVIKKAGAFYKFDVNGESIFSGIQGKEQLRSFLEENPDKLEILTKNIVFKEDKEAKSQAVEVEEKPEEMTEGELENLEEMLEQASDTFVKGKKGGKGKS